MKLKSFIILLIVCAVLGVAAYLTMMEKEPEDTGPKMGDLLFDDFPVNDVARIAIVSDKGTVTLKKADVWSVSERYNYPADFDKIRTFVKKFMDLKIGNVFKASSDTISRLELEAPDKKDIPEESKGVRVVLEDKKQTPVADIIVGAARESGTGGGHYLRMAGGEKVYLVDQSFRYMDNAPEDWIEKDLLTADAADIETMTCYAPDKEEPLYVLKRPEKGKDPEFSDPPENKKIKSSKVSSVMRAIASIRIEDIVDPAKGLDEVGLESPYRFEYKTFDGVVYKLRAAKPGEGDSTEHYLKMEASYDPPAETETDTEGESVDTESPEVAPAPAETETSGEDAASADQKTPEEIAQETETLNEKTAPWTYIVPKWKYDAFETDLNEFFEEEKKEEKQAG